MEPKEVYELVERMAIRIETKIDAVASSNLDAHNTIFREMGAINKKVEEVDKRVVRVETRDGFISKSITLGISILALFISYIKK